MHGNDDTMNIQSAIFHKIQVNLLSIYKKEAYAHLLARE